MIAKGLSTAVAAAVLIACGGSTTAADVPFRRIARGTFSDISTRQVLVIRDGAPWNAALARLRPADPPGAVDFATEMAIVVAAGDRPTGGYQVRVDRVDEEGSSLKIAAREETPHPSCAVPQVVTQPFEVVTVARSDRAVTADWTQVVGSPCQ